MTNEELWEALVDFMKGANESFATIDRRLDTLSARVGLLQPGQGNMVPCPACQDGLVFTPGDADDPASHDYCELCGGRGEVPDGVAAYVRKLLSGSFLDFLYPHSAAAQSAKGEGK